MQIHRDPEWNLNIGVDTVRLLAVKAQALSAHLNTEYEDGHEYRAPAGEGSDDLQPDELTAEEHHPDALVEEETPDATDEEFRQLVTDLNVDQAAELLAIAWIGRGDFSAAEWGRAVTEARNRVGEDGFADYLLGLPLLGDYLSDGLDDIGA